MSDHPPPRELTAEAADAGARLDAFCAARLTDRSRSQLRAAIAAGEVTVAGAAVKPAHKLREGDVVRIAPPSPRGPLVPPEAIPLTVLYEDEWLVAIDKPPGLVVHPSKGHQTGTLVNALVHRFAELSDTGDPLRPGIVHRLDRPTSGVILVAKRAQAHWQLAKQFEQRTTQKVYQCLVEGCPEPASGEVDRPIARHPKTREKMEVVEAPAGRAALTRYQVVERLGDVSWVRVRPRTGRTHQIRVHLLSLGCPLVCDALYGRRTTLEGPAGPLLERLALHAAEIRFDHPIAGHRMTIVAPLPEDLERTLAALRRGPPTQG